jgi:hypothetical protein
MSVRGIVTWWNRDREGPSGSRRHAKGAFSDIGLTRTDKGWAIGSASDRSGFIYYPC